MSGTSLDGLDLCLAEFDFDGKWGFRIIHTDCVNYDEDWRSKLATAHELFQEKLQQLNVEFGQFIGENVNSFLQENQLAKPELVCSHGHTVFHQPEKGITIQIGDGQTIADITGITCVIDFRSLDVSLGGQGAPLVPVGDELLFSEFDACLNLGGFSNISFKEDGERRAFDICPVNIVLNPLANRLGRPFDESGLLAKAGEIDVSLLTNLNKLAVYQTKLRPSLAREWLEKEFLPILDASSTSIENKLRTMSEHAAQQISQVINSKSEKGSVLVTGGGAKNGFLIERLQDLSNATIVIPDEQIINFKEALIFAFLGVLRIRNEINVLRSVTGAERDSCSGVVHFPSSVSG
jgi:anhydro-N-acetylmuramic acid kinase